MVLPFRSEQQYCTSRQLPAKISRANPGNRNQSWGVESRRTTYATTRQALTGTHPGSFEVAYQLRDGKHWDEMTAVDTQEKYDLRNDKRDRSCLNRFQSTLELERRAHLSLWSPIGQELEGARGSVVEVCLGVFNRARSGWPGARRTIREATWTRKTATWG